jgi:hypothetical protein
MATSSTASGAGAGAEAAEGDAFAEGDAAASRLAKLTGCRGAALCHGEDFQWIGIFLLYYP